MKEIFVPCSCKCCVVYFSKSDDGEDYNISIVDSYYKHYNGVFSRIKNALKVLFGKPIYYNDAFISKETMEKLVSDLNKML